MKVKVCGMREPANVEAVRRCGPDYLGFIFYEKSPRCVDDTLPPAQVRALPGVERVGVFVNETPDRVLARRETYGLDLIQLHGDESPAYCEGLHRQGVGLIKAFGVGPDFDFAVTEPYEPYCDYFLFDTKGAARGGNGTSFDWSALSRYANRKPFFLSGGIGLAELGGLRYLPPGLRVHALDVNSKLETAPGFKDVARVAQLTENVKKMQTSDA